MRRILLSIAPTMAVINAALVQPCSLARRRVTGIAQSRSRRAMRPFPDGPGADAINGNCLPCHSADHIFNQPNLPKETWEAGDDAPAGTVSPDRMFVMKDLGKFRVTGTSLKPFSPGLTVACGVSGYR